MDINALYARDLETWLVSIDDALAKDPANRAMHYERGIALKSLERYADSAAAFQALIKLDTKHFWAMVYASQMLSRAGDAASALRLASQLVALYPTEEMAHRTLAVRYREAGKFVEAKHFLTLGLKHHPESRESHAELALCLDALGETDLAQGHRENAERLRYIDAWQYRGKVPPTPLLLVVAKTEARKSIYLERLLNNSLFSVSVIAAEDLAQVNKLPPAEILVNGIADADITGEALDVLEALTTLDVPKTPVSGAAQSTPDVKMSRLVGTVESTISNSNPQSSEALSLLRRIPIINAPASVKRTGRGSIAERLGKIPNVRTPKTVLVSRDILLAHDNAAAIVSDLGFDFPILLRTPGFQAGRLFTRVDAAEDFAAALAEIPGDDIFVIEYIDVVEPPGVYRKYRVIMIDGQLYPLHLAFAASWKVHYFSSEMASNGQFRSLEADFLNDMPTALGSSALSALQTIEAELGLDYAGIDFTLHNNQLLVFEANPAMTVAAPSKEPHWAYRKPAAQRIFAAMEAMLIRRCSVEA